MYTINHGTGVVEKDGVPIAPCDSADDVEFRKYIDWVEAGNEPAIVEYFYDN